MWEDVEKFLKRLVKGEFSHLSLTFNDGNGANYVLVGEYLTMYDDHHFDWISEEEKKKAIELNSLWVLQWYPDTPVGFCAFAASSLSALMKFVGQLEDTLGERDAHY